MHKKESEGLQYTNVAMVSEFMWPVSRLVTFVHLCCFDRQSSGKQCSPAVIATLYHLDVLAMVV